MQRNETKYGFKIDYESIGRGKNFDNISDEERFKKEQLLNEDYQVKLNEIIAGRVISENGIMFIPLENVNSSICYFISAIQRLHGSGTLNKEIINRNLKAGIKNSIIAEDIEKVLMPLKIYARINENNIAGVFKSITEAHKTLFDDVFNPVMYQGGDSQRVLIWLLFPLLYIVFDIEIVKKIIQEVNFDTNRFSGLNISNNLLSIIENGFNRLEPMFIHSSTNDFVRNSNKLFISALNNYISNINQHLDDSDIKSTTIGNMSLFFNDENGERSKHPGHAVIVIKNNEGKYMVIDDAVNIREISNYVRQCGKRIYKLELRDIADKDVREIKKLLGNCEVDARIYRTIINLEPQNSLLGGGVLENDDAEETDVKTETEETKDEKYVSREEFEQIKDSLHEILDDMKKEQVEQHKNVQQCGLDESLQLTQPSQPLQQPIQSIQSRHQATQQLQQYTKIESFTDLYNAITGCLWINRTFIEKCLLLIIIILIVSITVFVIVNNIKYKITEKKIKECKEKLDKVKNALKINYSIYYTYVTKVEHEPVVPIIHIPDKVDDNLPIDKPKNKNNIMNFVNEYKTEILNDINQYVQQEKPLSILDLKNSNVLNKIITKKSLNAGEITNKSVDYNTKPFTQSNDFIY